MAYLCGADLVPCDKGKRLEEGAKEDILAKTASNRKNERQLGHKRQYADQCTCGRCERQVDIVEPERKVVAMVLPCDMVQVRLEQELVSVPKKHNANNNH